MVVTGNEYSAHHVISELAGVLVDIGVTVPGQSWTYCNMGRRTWRSTRAMPGRPPPAWRRLATWSRSPHPLGHPIPAPASQRPTRHRCPVIQT